MYSSSTTGRRSTIDFGDAQRLRVIGDELLRIDHILETNLMVCKNLTGFSRLSRGESPTRLKAEAAHRAIFSVTETELQRNRVASLLKRMGSSSELVSEVSSSVYVF